ncbi:MAG: hypothetical protein ACLSUW_07895 [Akkermansia sp.]
MPAKTHQDILLMRWALFSVAGLSLLVALYYLGLTPVWAGAEGSHGLRPVSASPGRPALSPGTGFLLCMALTLALVYDLLLIRGTLRKTAVLAVSSFFWPALPRCWGCGAFLQCRPMPAFRRERGRARHPLSPNASCPASFRTSFRS